LRSVAESRRSHPWIERLREQRIRHLERNRVFRVGFALLGFTIVLVGLAMLVLPGPGLLVMAVGFAMLALEFAWAERVLESTLERMDKTTKTVKRATRLQKALSAATGIAALIAFALVVKYFDVPLFPF
jgi:uncharacterized protein (TIGR02611 family)